VLTGHVDLRVAAGIVIGGIPAVLAAAFIVKEMPIEALRWLVAVVVVYAAIVMLRAAFKGRGESPSAAPEPVPLT
jgi:uncharacterized membrane protein YfcA